MNKAIPRLIRCGSVRQLTRACDWGERIELIPPYLYPETLRLGRPR
ncbi:hypothetical protein [Brevundimonas sp.]|nr:hypothetical protein [Brevundimonas sp.]